METREEYIARMTEKAQRLPDGIREKVLANIAMDWERRERDHRDALERIERICKAMIPKEELRDGGLYTGPRDLARDMWFGTWDAKRQTFVCLKFEMGNFIKFDLPYFGDVVMENMAGLAPMKKVEDEKY